MKFRPDNWVNPFHCMDKHIKRKHDIYESGADAILTVRDQWWLSRLEQYRCGDRDDLANGYIMIPPDDFNALKSSIGLTALMGAFPDLPDVREVGQ